MVGVSLTAIAFTSQAQAECSPAPTANNDVIICTSAAPNPSASLNLLAGDDTIDLQGGIVTGSVMGNDGNDRITLNGAIVGGLLTGDAGDDIISVISGSTAGVTGGDGADWISVSGGSAGALNGDAGNDQFTVSGGTVASITDALGNNILTMPAGGTGVITGNVTFGPGVDTVDVASGQINGSVIQGDGLDVLTLSGGMINAVFQGGGLDTATISGGRIINGLEDGDFVTITGGRIGFVDMNIANNVVTMSGGQIDGDLTASFQNDTLNLSGGTIGGRVDFGRGANNITMTGGTIVGTITTGDGIDTYAVSGGSTAGINAGAGNDSIALSGAGRVGAINAGDGDDAFNWTGGTLTSFNGGIGSDTALITGGADLSQLAMLDGGDDSSAADGWIDVLTFRGVSAKSPKMANWEQTTLTQNTVINITPDGGDFGGGNVSIDSTSRLTGGPDAGGTVDIGGDLDNDGEVITETPVDFNIGGTIDNGGTIELGGGGAINVVENVANGGALIVSGNNTAIAIGGDLINGGTVDISGRGNTLNVSGDLINGGRIDLTDSDAVVTVDGALTNNGTIMGSGGSAVIDARGGLANGGTIDLSGGGAGDSLTIIGDVTGHGTLIIDTNITESGGSADRLVIEGALSGTIDTNIININGPVTAPPQEGSGVTIIATTEGSNAVITLNAPFNYAPIGPWRYELAQAGGEVRLESRFDSEGGVSFAALTPSAAGAVIAPEAVLGITEMFLPHIRERQGQALTGSDGFQGWARVAASVGDLDGKGYSVGYHQRSGLAQVGIGFAKPTADTDMLMLGATLGMARGDWTPRLRSARADMDVEATAFGLYASWFEQADQSGGWYADFVAQMSSFDFELDVSEARIADYDGYGIGASMEVGYITQTGAWRIEPKLRFTYLSSHVDAFVGADGLQAQMNENERYRGRLAVRISTDTPLGGSVLTPTLTLGVAHDFKADRGVFVGFDRLEANSPKTVAEAGAGLNLRIGSGALLFTEAEGHLASDYWQAGIRAGASIRW